MGDRGRLFQFLYDSFKTKQPLGWLTFCLFNL